MPARLAYTPRFMFGETVRVAWNFHRKLFSVYRNVPTESGADRWKVAFWMTDVFLKDVRFIVSAKGRERGIRLGKKVVHAWVEGTVVPPGDWGKVTLASEGIRTPIVYNPKSFGTFMAYPGEAHGPLLGITGGGAGVEKLPPEAVLAMTTQASVSKGAIGGSPAKEKVVYKPQMTAVVPQARQSSFSEARIERLLRDCTRHPSDGPMGSHMPLPRAKPLPPRRPRPQEESLTMRQLETVRARLRIQREVAQMPGPYSHSSGKQP